MAKNDYLDYVGLQSFYRKLENYIKEKISGITPASIGASATGHTHFASEITGATLNNFIVGDGANAMQEKTPAQVLELIGAAGKSNLISVTLTSGSWSNGTQTVSNNLIKADGYVYLIFPDEDSKIIYNASGVKAQEITTSGSITFQCEGVPGTDLTVNIVMLEVN